MSIEKLEQRIEQLNTENTADQQRLKKLESEYETAVSNLELEQADKLQTEITNLKSGMDSRKKQINILSNPDNPLRVENKKKALKKAEKERDALKQKADELHERILKAQQEYIEVANELFEINNEYRKVNMIFHNANGTQIPSGPYLNPYAYKINIGTDRYGRDAQFKGGI